MFKPETIEKIDFMRRQKRFAQFFGKLERKIKPESDEFLENIAEAIAIEFNLSIHDVAKIKPFLRISSTVHE